MQRFVVATIGSRTERDGIVVEADPKEEGSYVGGQKIACVGDLFRYTDGNESVIVSGAGDISMIENRPVALVGSPIANDDHIISSLQTVFELSFDDGDEPPPGMLQPGFAQANIVRHA